MSMNFPSPAIPGQVYTPVGGYSYVFLDGVWRIVQDAQSILTADTRNRVVNGAMQISQETAFETGTLTAGGYVADQWAFNFVNAGAPRGFCHATEPGGKFIRFNSWATPDTSVAAGDLAQLVQRVEGIRIADFEWGTASAKPVVLRFTARCGTLASLVIGVSLRNTDGSRAFVKNVTLTNAWQDFVIPIPGDTTGTWARDTSHAMWLSFTGMCGSTFIAASEGVWTGGGLAAAGVGNVMSVASGIMDFKNVGLYLDPLATGVPPRWQMPDEAEELRACQRYYYQISLAAGSFNWAGAAGATFMDAATIAFPTTMRTTPAGTNSTVTYTNSSALSLYTTPNDCLARLTATAIGAYRAYGYTAYFNARM